MTNKKMVQVQTGLSAAQQEPKSAETNSKVRTLEAELETVRPLSLIFTTSLMTCGLARHQVEGTALASASSRSDVLPPSLQRHHLPQPRCTRPGDRGRADEEGCDRSGTPQRPFAGTSRA